MVDLVKVIEKSSHLNLLFVEDNIDSRESIFEILEEFFGEVFVGVDGKDGLEKLSKIVLILL